MIISHLTLPGALHLALGQSEATSQHILERTLEAPIPKKSGSVRTKQTLQ